MKNDEIRNDRLVPLSSMKDYKVAKDNPDILGWRVVGADGESLGMVKDLIVDPQLMKARYLSVVADRRFFNSDTDPYILVPIGAAALDKKGKNVFVAAVDSNSIANYPIYQGGAIPEDYEYAVRDMYLRSQNESLSGTTDYKSDFEESLHREPKERHHISNDFYDHDSYNEDRFYTSQVDDERRVRPATANGFTKTEHADRDTSDIHTQGARPKNVEDAISTIERLENLRERGSITDEEFILLKKRALDL